MILRSTAPARPLGLAATVLLIASGSACRGPNTLSDARAFGEPVLLRDAPQALPEHAANARIRLEQARREGELASFRQEWLTAEQRLNEAKAAFARALEVEARMEIEIIRYKQLNAKLPALPKAHPATTSAPTEIVTQAPSAWEYKLRDYKATTAEREAKVRILLRKTRPLRKRAAREGLFPAPPEVSNTATVSPAHPPED